MTKKSYAKINIFLKIIGKRGDYHELSSRFVRIKKIHDTISFEEKQKEDKSFRLEGDFSCSFEDNTITKAFSSLQKSDHKKKIEEFFTQYKVVVEKNIPEFSGFGGGSSNAATFLLLCNEVLKLGMTKEELVHYGVQIGADVPFFIYEYESANVSGIGEKVEVFYEEPPSLVLATSHVQCSTKKVFEYYRENFFDNSHKNFEHWQRCTSEELLKTFSPFYLNDLFQSALYLYPMLKRFAKDRWFMSGSGSGMFKVGHG